MIKKYLNIISYLYFIVAYFSYGFLPFAPHIYLWFHLLYWEANSQLQNAPGVRHKDGALKTQVTKDELLYLNLFHVGQAKCNMMYLCLKHS